MLAENPLFVIAGGTTASSERLGRMGAVLVRRFGGRSMLHIAEWAKPQGIDAKARELNDQMGEMAGGADRIIVIGMSAAGSQGLYMYHQILDEETRGRTRLALVCARVAQEPVTSENDAVYKRSEDYEEGVVLAQEITQRLTPAELLGITTYAGMADRVAPPEAVWILGARNEIAPDPSLDHQGAMGRFFKTGEVLERLLIVT